MKFSANLGFLWNDRPLPDAVRAAAAAGFHAVECHWPFDTPPADLRAALHETDLPLLGLNTRRGDVGAGDNGLAAVPGREAEARSAIDEAVDYAADVGARHVHVMAGNADGRLATESFVRNLRYACTRAERYGLTVVIEALNPHDAPGYFLRTTGQAAEIIAQTSTPNLRLMFDCYHVARTEGDVLARLAALWPVIGHIQFAGVPDRGPPDRGTLNYREVFAAIRAHGFSGALGAEYRVAGRPEASLGWMHSLVT